MRRYLVVLPFICIDICVDIVTVFRRCSVPLSHRAYMKTIGLRSPVAYIMAKLTQPQASTLYIKLVTSMYFITKTEITIMNSSSFWHV